MNGLLDDTLESVSIARRMARFCKQAEINDFRLILNKTESCEMESLIMDKLEKPGDRVIGIVSCDQSMIAAALSGKPPWQVRVSAGPRAYPGKAGTGDCVPVGKGAKGSQS